MADQSISQVIKPDFFLNLVFIKIMAPEYIQFIGIGAGILTSVSMLPQLIKTFKEKKAEEISILMILVLITGIAGWIWYGILRNDLPIIFTNSFSFLLNAMLLFFRFKYAGK